MAENERIRPDRQARARLLQAIAAVPQLHVVDPGALGEYAQLLVEQGPAVAARELPEVARHLASGCADCTVDLDELIALTAEIDLDLPSSPISPRSVGTAGMTSERPAPGGSSGGLTGSDLSDSSIHVRDLPDPRQAETRADADASRRQQLRRWRERLLIAAALAVVAMGLSLIGLAYLARAPQEAPRLDLAPITTPGSEPTRQVAPPAVPGQTAPAAPAPPAQPGGAQTSPSLPLAPQQPAPAPAAPPAQTTGSGVAAPLGVDCPSSHPVKGNRSSMIYHVPGGGFYSATRPEQCFAQPSDAEAAGYRRSQR
jgi:hypothetical protein